MFKKFLSMGLLLFFLLSPSSSPEEIIFDNGDRLTASILSDSPESITIYSQAIGTVDIDRAFISSPVFEGIEPRRDDEDKKAEWTRKVAIGFSKSAGNTVRQEANGAIDFNRKTDLDETTLNFSLYYASSNDKMDVQQYYGLARHAFSFGKDLKWYNFYKLESSHDYFANIDYRLIPSTGFGYWFSDDEQFKLLFESAVGLEYTSYRNQEGSESRFILLPRGYFKKKLSGDFWVEQNLVFYLVTEDLSKYRLRSESSLIHRISKQLFWKLSLIDEYDADPAKGVKDNDYRIIYAIEYLF